VTIKRALAAAAAAVLLLAGAYAGFLGHRARHVVSLAPGGPFRVGRAVQEIADRSRTDELAPVGGNPRVLSITLWYPAAATGGTPSEYAPGAWSGLHRFGLAETNFKSITTGTYDDAPLAGGPFPIVVLLPALGLAAPQYSALAARIAARGYLVAGVTPTYSAGLTVLGGKPVRGSAAGRPGDLDGPAGDRLATVWAADARFTAGRVAVLLGAHARASDVIYLGHAFGGAAALEACRTDRSCRGAADLDGKPRGEVVTGGLPGPALLITAGTATNAATRRFFRASAGRTRAYAFPATRHLDFTDYGVYWLAAPLRQALGLGDRRTVRITADYVSVFLDSVTAGTPWRAPAEPGVREADMLVR
jgi:dienelactone hydrolase